MTNRYVTLEMKRDRLVGKTLDTLIQPISDYTVSFLYKNSESGALAKFSVVMRIQESEKLKAEKLQETFDDFLNFVNSKGNQLNVFYGVGAQLSLLFDDIDREILLN